MARKVPGGCRFLSTRGRFGPVRRHRCPRPAFPLRATLRGGSWSRRGSVRLTPGIYVVLIRAIDAAGHRQYPPVTRRLRVR